MLSPSRPLLQHVSPPTPSGPRGKPVTRRTVLSKRDALTADDRALASLRIAERVNELLLGTLSVGKMTVALYSPKGSEVDTFIVDEHVRNAGGRVVYPRVVDDTKVLEFYAVAPEQLIPGRFGLREPRADWRNAVGLVEIGAVIVPGLAFDRGGGRVGWGHGHYDATLAAAPDALRIGLAFECQLVDEVPREPHDALLHYVVTDVATYKA
jgi:5-formyltetrahydrofolate cyclo-ligase